METQHSIQLNKGAHMLIFYVKNKKQEPFEYLITKMHFSSLQKTILYKNKKSFSSGMGGIKWRIGNGQGMNFTFGVFHRCLLNLVPCHCHCVALTPQ